MTRKPDIGQSRARSTVAREYGWRARFGLGVPEANPTVEPEFRRLMPEGYECYVVRLTATERDAALRVGSYLTNLEGYLARYDELRLDGFGFAMTGAAYVLGLEAEQRIVAEAEARFGYRVVTCSAAIDAALRALGARRIQLVSPYPDFLVQAGRRYWGERGYDVVRVVDIPRPREDIRGIYDIGSDAVAATLRATPCHDVDAVVLSGTGVPTLAVLERASELVDRPLLASNACLAESLMELIPETTVSPPSSR